MKGCTFASCYQCPWYLEFKDRRVDGFSTMTFEATDDGVEHLLSDGHLFRVVVSCSLRDKKYRTHKKLHQKRHYVFHTSSLKIDICGCATQNLCIILVLSHAMACVFRQCICFWTMTSCLLNICHVQFEPTAIRYWQFTIHSLFYTLKCFSKALNESPADTVIVFRESVLNVV